MLGPTHFLGRSIFRAPFFGCEGAGSNVK
jgi:hypothetical protein